MGTTFVVTPSKSPPECLCKNIAHINHRIPNSNYQILYMYTTADWEDENKIHNKSGQMQYKLMMDQPTRNSPE